MSQIEILFVIAGVAVVCAAAAAILAALTS